MVFPNIAQQTTNLVTNGVRAGGTALYAVGRNVSKSAVANAETTAGTVLSVAAAGALLSGICLQRLTTETPPAPVIDKDPQI